MTSADSQSDKSQKAKPSLKPRVHQQLLETLARRILSGEYAPESVLPPEPTLCEELGASRSALREAVKVLGGKGLIVTRPRAGTIVRPKSDWNLLDSDILAWSTEVMPKSDLMASLMEARQAIEPAAARLAAERASLTEIAQMEDAFLRMKSATQAQDAGALLQADIDFHTSLLKASGNLVFQQLSNIIGAALGYSFSMSAANAHDTSESLQIHAEIVERIRLRDGKGARDTAIRLLEIAAIDLGLQPLAGEDGRTRPSIERRPQS